MTRISKDSADAAPFTSWTEPVTEADRAEVVAEEIGIDPTPQQVEEYLRAQEK